MTYTIGEVSKMTNITISTLRYYDQQGLFKELTKNESGIRIFTDSELLTIKWINCLKATGMSLKDIKHYLDMNIEGDSTLQTRLELFNERERDVRKQIQELEKTLEMIEIKKWWYSEAINHGTETYVKELPTDDYPPEIYNLFVSAFGESFERNK